MEKNFKVVSQNSDLGKLGLEFLFDSSSYINLRSDKENLWFEIKEEEYVVSLYKSSRSVKKGNKYYALFNEFL